MGALRGAAAGPVAGDRAARSRRLLAPGPAGAPRLAPAGRLRRRQGASPLRAHGAAHGRRGAARHVVGLHRRARGLQVDLLPAARGAAGHPGHHAARVDRLRLPLLRPAGRALPLAHADPQRPARRRGRAPGRARHLGHRGRHRRARHASEGRPRRPLGDDLRPRAAAGAGGHGRPARRPLGGGVLAGRRPAGRRGPRARAFRRGGPALRPGRRGRPHARTLRRARRC